MKTGYWKICVFINTLEVNCFFFLLKILHKFITAILHRISFQGILCLPYLKNMAKYNEVS